MTLFLVHSIGAWSFFAQPSSTNKKDGDIVASPEIQDMYAQARVHVGLNFQDSFPPVFYMQGTDEELANKEPAYFSYNDQRVYLNPKKSGTIARRNSLIFNLHHEAMHEKQVVEMDNHIIDSATFFMKAIFSDLCKIAFCNPADLEDYRKVEDNLLSNHRQYSRHEGWQLKTTYGLCQLFWNSLNYVSNGDKMQLVRLKFEMEAELGAFQACTKNGLSSPAQYRIDLYRKRGNAPSLDDRHPLPEEHYRYLEQLKRDLCTGDYAQYWGNSFMDPARCLSLVYWFEKKTGRKMV